MKRTIITVTLALCLATTTGGWLMQSSVNQKLEAEILFKNSKIEQKSTKIANLENVIVKKDKSLESKTKAIDNQKKAIDEQSKQIEEKDKSIQQKDDEIKELKEELANFKNREKGSDVGGRKITVTATAYVAMCSEGCTGRTATGVDVSNTIYYKGYRVIAVDTSLIPLNSLVKVETENQSFTAMAIDTGGAIDGHIIDVLVKSENEARQFGRTKATLTILREGE